MCIFNKYSATTAHSIKLYASKQLLKSTLKLLLDNCCLKITGTQFLRYWILKRSNNSQKVNWYFFSITTKRVIFSCNFGGKSNGMFGDKLRHNFYRATRYFVFQAIHYEILWECIKEILKEYENSISLCFQ